jgi:hypothetical protein
MKLNRFIIVVVCFASIQLASAPRGITRWRAAAGDSAVDSLQTLCQEVRQAPISVNTKRALLVSLKTAARSYDSSRLGSGSNQLRAFQHKVRAHLGKSRPDLAAALIRGAQEVIDSCNVTLYDLSRDFSVASNPSGVWTYGYSTNLGSELIPFTFSKYNYDENDVAFEVWAINSWEVPAVQHNNTSQTLISDGGQGIYPPGTVWFYPGPSTIDGSADASESIAAQANFGVLRFTVPADGGGDYDVLAAVRSAYTGPISGDTDFHVLVNGTEVFGEFLPAEGRTAYNTQLSLNPGDTVDFVIGRGEDNSYHGSGLIIDATLAKSCATPGSR